MKYLVTSGRLIAKSETELTQNLEEALLFRTIGEAMKFAINLNNLLGKTAFRVMSIEG